MFNITTQTTIDKTLQKILRFTKANILYFLGATLIACSIGLQHFTREENLPSLEIKERSEMNENEEKLISVSVVGGVLKPGQYKLPENSTVSDAIIVAGGFVSNIDNQLILNMDLKSTLHDMQEIDIPTQKVSTKDDADNAQSGFSRKISLNKAGPDELKQLPGIGDARSKSIINGRPYSDTYEIVQKKIIGEATFEKIKNEITL